MSDAPNGSSKVVIGLYLVASVLAVSAIGISRGRGADVADFERAVGDLGAEPTSGEVGTLPAGPCKACEKKREFFVDPAGSEGLNAGRRVLHDLALQETWDEDAWEQALTLAGDPASMITDLETLERRWLVCLAIDALRERMSVVSAEAADSRVVEVIRDGVYDADPAVRYQSLRASGVVGALGPEEFEIALIDLSLDYPAALLTELRRSGRGG